MKTKSKVPGHKKLYFGTVIFSLAWLFLSVIFPATRRLDYSWDYFVVNLPQMLSFFDPSVKEVSPEYIYGKYVNRAPNPKITITALDELTLSKYGWPIKRRFYGELVDRLNKLGVKSIGVDIILAEPDRDNPENDRAYVEAAARAGNVVNLTFVDPDTNLIKHPIEGLAGASALIAHPEVGATKDSDGQVRRYRPFLSTDEDMDGTLEKWFTYKDAGFEIKDLRCGKGCAGLPVPSLGMAAYAVYSGVPLAELVVKYDQEEMLNYRYLSVRKGHPGWDKNAKDVKTSTFRHISAADILSGKLSEQEKEALRGGITFIGSTATAAFDHVPSPFSNQLPGVEVHATFLDNLIAGDFRRPLPLEYFTLLVLLFPWLPVFLRKLSMKTLLSVSFAFMGALVITDIVLLSNCVVMPFSSVFLAFFLPFSYITLDKGLAEGREKKWIKNTFGQYLSPKVVEIITRDPSRLTLGGEKREMTVFFLDIAGFTTMSEKLPPEQLTALLNKYLSGLTDVILRHDGVVDKFIGDSIMAFWNAPLDQKDHRKLACLAAVDCVAEMDRLNAAQAESSARLSCRIGLNTGPMVVGNMGSMTRFSYTVMGDAVNLGSRLEGANKFFHSRIMVSGETFEEARDLLEARYLGQIRVVGKAIPVKVYEPLARRGEAAPEIMKMLVSYNKGMDNFSGGRHSAAAEDFKAALEARPGDGPSRFYLELAEKYAREVPGDWDGSFNLTAK